MSDDGPRLSRKEVEADSPASRRGRTRSRQTEPAAPEASVDMDELRELIALLRENGLAEFELEREGFRVRLRRESSALPQPGEGVANPTTPRTAPSAQQPSIVPAHPGARAETAASEDQDLYI